MLVAAFQIHVGARAGPPGGPVEIRPAPAFQHEGMGAARIEPHVENVGHAFVVRSAIRAAQVLLRPGIAPGIDPAGLDRRDDPRVDRRIAQVLAGLPIDEQRDRNAPGALAAEHPVGPPFNHAADAVAALFRDEAGGGNRGQRGFAQGFAGLLFAADTSLDRAERGLPVDLAIHRHEPLRRAAEDHLGLRPPRVRIGMLVVRRGGEQRAGFAQVGADRAVGRVELGIDHAALAAQPAPVGAILAIAFDREDRLQPVRLAQQEVVFAMVGGHVDQPGAAIGGDKVARQERARPGKEIAQRVHRVAGHRAGQLGPAPGGDFAAIAQPAGADLALQLDRAEIAPAIVVLVEAVGHLRTIGDRLVGRDGPRGRGPDHRMGADQFLDRAVGDFEGKVDLGAGDVLVFDLGFGQRGLFDRRPHHRLGAAIELAAFGELEQLGHDRALGLRVHGQVGMVPISQNPQPLELFALHVDPVLRIGPAFGAELDRIDLVLVELLLAVLFLNLPFDRQAVAIPARNIGRVLAQQVLGAADHVLEDVIERVADMHVAIGVGRTIVEDELLAPGARLAQPAIEVLPVPPRQNARLLLRKPGLHGEIGLRQEDGVSIVARFGHSARALAGAAALRNF